MASSPLRLLCLEDDPDDVWLVRRTLERGGLPFEVTIASDEREFVRQLDERVPDVILSDYSLPGFNGRRALQIVRERELDVPFVFVTGSLGEELAVELLTEGATDYILKDRLSRLVPAILRAVREKAERKELGRAEAALKARESQLRLAVEAAEMVTFAWSRASGIELLPERPRAVGHIVASLSSLTPRALLRHVHPLDRRRLLAAVWMRGYCGERQFELDIRVSADLKEWRWLACRGSVHLGGDGRPVMAQGIVSDVTARREYENAIEAACRAAEAAAQARDRFIAKVSHETRTPLNAVVCGLELLSDTLSEEQVEYYQIIRDGAQQLRRIIDDILDFSGLMEGTFRLKRERFDLRDWLVRVFRPFDVEAANRGLTLNVTISPNVPAEAIADAGRLRQILDNIVGNAFKFTGDGGSVNVTIDAARLADNRTELRFTVQDSGVGIPEADRERIFYPFTQVDDSLRRQHGGTGLGLAIVKRLIELLSGSIAVESREGKGTRFTFSVVVERVGDAAIPQGSLEQAIHAMPADDGPPDEGLQLHVLVVEDNAVNALVVSKLLERLGCRVTIVSDGPQAVERSAAEEFDLILMDLQVPGIDGCEATRAIRVREATNGRHTPIVGISAHVGSQGRDAAFDSGMDDFLEKPVTLKDLASKLRHTTRQSGAPDGPA